VERRLESRGGCAARSSRGGPGAQGRYLRLLLDEHGGDVRVALAAYNAGSARARLRPADWPSETRAYVARILARAATAAPGRSCLGSARRTGPIGARLVG
jgi:hypothetical protein